MFATQAEVWWAMLMSVPCCLGHVDVDLQFRFSPWKCEITKNFSDVLETHALAIHIAMNQ